MLRALVYIIPLAMAIYALIDLSRSTPTDRGGLNPLLWVAVIVLLPVIGPLVWIILSTARRGGPGAGNRPAAPRRPAPGRPWNQRRSGPPAPDDDPDFLWRIERERRRREQQNRGDRPDGNGPASPTEPPEDQDPPRG